MFGTTNNHRLEQPFRPHNHRNQHQSIFGIALWLHWHHHRLTTSYAIASSCINVSFYFFHLNSIIMLLFCLYVVNATIDYLMHPYSILWPCTITCNSEGTMNIKDQSLLEITNNGYTLLLLTATLPVYTRNASAINYRANSYLLQDTVTVITFSYTFTPCAE